VQQRAGEFATLLEMDGSVDLFAPIASSGETEDLKQSIQIDAAVSPTQNAENQAGNNLLVMMLQGKQPAAPQPSQTEDLLGLLSDIPNPQPVQQPPTVVAKPEPVIPVQPAVAVKPVQPTLPGTELLRKNDFVIYGQTKTNPADARMVALMLVAVTTGSTLTEFKFQFQVTPGWKINAQPPDGNVLAPGKSVAQVLYLVNTVNTPFQLNLRIAYKFGAQPLMENGTITSLPRP
jgi:hypothetical protein